jgi:hypothetical protein
MNECFWLGFFLKSQLLAKALVAGFEFGRFGFGTFGQGRRARRTLGQGAALGRCVPQPLFTRNAVGLVGSARGAAVGPLAFGAPAETFAGIGQLARFGVAVLLVKDPVVARVAIGPVWLADTDAMVVSVVAKSVNAVAIHLRTLLRRAFETRRKLAMAQTPQHIGGETIVRREQAVQTRVNIVKEPQGHHRRHRPLGIRM